MDNDAPLKKLESMGPAKLFLVLAVPFLLLHLVNFRTGLVGDSQAHLYQAASLVHSASYDLSRFADLLSTDGELPYFAIERNGRIYSIFNFFPALLLAPFFLVGRLILPGFGENVHLWGMIGRLVALFFVLGGAYFLWELARRRFHLLAAIFATTAFLYATSLGPSSVDYLQHHPMVFFMLLGLFLLFGTNDGGPPSPRRVYLAGLALGAAFLSRYQILPSIILIGIVYAIHNRHHPRLVGALAAGGVTLAPLFLVYHTIAFGHPLRTGPNLLLAFDAPFLETLRELLLNSSKGLLVHSPWIALSLLAIVPMGRRLLRREGWDPMAVALYLSMIPTLLIYGKLNGWYGGWSWGPRYLSELLPAAALLLAVFIDSFRAMFLRILLPGVLVVAGFLIAMVGNLTYDGEWHDRHDFGLAPHQDWLDQSPHNQIAYGVYRGRVHLFGRELSLWESPYEAHGFNEPEDWDGVTAVWTKDRARFYYVPTEYPPRIELYPNHSGAPPQVDLVVNGRPRSIMLLPGGWNQIRIPGGRFQRGAIIEISIPNTHHVEEGTARVMGVAIKLNGAGNLY